MWCSTRSIPGSAEELGIYSVLAGCSSGRLVVHSQPSASDKWSAESCCVMSWSNPPHWIGEL